MENKFNIYHDLKCIWMASNIVDYKLCDKDFDCENCSFDKVIRNSSFENDSDGKVKGNILDDVLEKLQDVNYDEKVIYLKNCLIMKRIFANTFYLGLNPMLKPFLDNISSLKECDLGKYILKGQPVFQFTGEWGTVTLTSPMNFLMYDRMTSPHEDISKSKWMAIIGAIQPEIDASVIGKSRWNEMLYKTFEIIDDMKLNVPAVGSTMLDGGTKIKYLYQFAGKDKYQSILESMLNQ